MNDRRSPARHEPRPALGWLYARFFESIEVDEAWLQAVREADRRGTGVYVLRNLSVVDFLALGYLTKRHQLPELRFANDFGTWILQPMRGGLFSALRKHSPAADAAELEYAVQGGHSAALFLKRPPHLLEGTLRGK